nr:hypothetical protein [Aeromonas media]
MNSRNTISSSVGLLASFGAQFAAGGVCRVKGRGLSTLCSYRGAAQDDFSSRDLTSLTEIYSGLAAWSQHYWNLLALETQNYQLQQLVKNHNKPSAIIDERGIFIIPMWRSTASPMKTSNCGPSMVFSLCKIRSSNASSRRP